MIFAHAVPSRAKLEKSSSLPAAESDSTARIMASLSRAASSSHSLDSSSSSDDAPGPSSKASFTSQRSGSPFTAKRDKSFLDVQRFLGDSLSKSASKGKSFAKQLQVRGDSSLLVSADWVRLQGLGKRKLPVFVRIICIFSF